MRFYMMGAKLGWIPALPDLVTSSARPISLVYLTPLAANTFLYGGHKSRADGYVGSANDPPNANEAPL